MYLNERGRPLCKDESCGAEIDTGKYCRGHQYLIAVWLRRSKTKLAEYKQRYEQQKEKH